jgi:restriction system protein
MNGGSSTIWGIHAGRTGDADALFKKGYIALGWNELGDLSSLPPTPDTFRDRVAAAYPNAKPGSWPVTAGQLRRFVHEVKTGDLVVSRSKVEHVIRIGRVTGPYRYDPGLDANYPHVRPTEWLAAVQPAQVTQGARYEIGAAMTLFQVKTYADEWRALLTGKSPPPLPTEEPVADPTLPIVAEEIETLTRDFILQRLAQDLKGHPFAAFVAHLLGTMGYRTRVSPEGPDGGVDIVAHRDELGFEPPIVKVQVKSTSGNTGQPEVSALLGTLAANEFGLVVTLGGFTPPARTFARSKANLRLVDGEELVDLVLAHYERFDPRYKGLLPLKRVYVPAPIDTESA